MKGGMTVANVMRDDVVTVSPAMTVRELSRVLTDAGISGAPVVDAQGSTVGVVSATDILRLSAEASEVSVGDDLEELEEQEWRRDDGLSGDESADLYDFFVASDAPLPAVLGERGALAQSHLDGYSVQDIMTPATFTVGSGDSIEELAAFLLKGRIHRALVEEEGRLAGIVTSFDVLKALVDDDDLVEEG